MIITDLDGTLLSPKQTVSRVDYDTLIKAGKKGILRVLATGRSLFSLSKVIPDEFPLDYIIFSSGIGVIDWQKKETIFSSVIEGSIINDFADYLKREAFDFMVHKPVPNNHYFYYHHNDTADPDFWKRVNLYGPYAERLNGNLKFMKQASQFVIVCNGYKGEDYRFKHQVAPLTVIRATSPINGRSTWIEVLPEAASKSKASARLAEYCNVDPSGVVAIGNDYNDADLLDWAPNAYIMENAPESLRTFGRLTASNRNSGFSKAVHQEVNFEEYNS
jgi:Cof subfamily protein (haloacid dehalogenase superfamily)